VAGNLKRFGPWRIAAHVVTSATLGKLELLQQKIKLSPGKRGERPQLVCENGKLTV